MSNDIGSDKRKHPFIVVDQVVIDDYDLTPYEGWLYVVIIGHVNHKTGVAFPSIATLAKEAKMSRQQVMRCIASLEAKGLIEVERKNKKDSLEKEVNHYIVLDPNNATSIPPKGSTCESLGSDCELLQVVPVSHNNQIEINQIKDSAPAALEVETPKDETPAQPTAATRKRDPMFDVVAWRGFGIPIGAPVSEGGRIGKLVSFLKGNTVKPSPKSPKSEWIPGATPPATVDEVVQFYNAKGKYAAQDVTKFSVQFVAWRSETEQRKTAQGHYAPPPDEQKAANRAQFFKLPDTLAG